MDSLKKHPFLAGLIAAVAVSIAASGYWTYSAFSRFAEQQQSLDGKRGEIESLQASKPFPDQNNVQAAKAELKRAEEILAENRKAFAVVAPSISPQAFQDDLRGKVSDIIKRAQANGVMLAQSFYLGFEVFEKQPPAVEEAPSLAVELESIYAAVGKLVDARVKSIVLVAREVPGQAQQTPEGQTEKPAHKGKNQSEQTTFALRAFSLTFTSDQASFKNALNSIVSAKPPIFVRLVAITNSTLSGPPKSGEAVATEQSPAAEASAEEGKIKPVLGRELLTINLHLAAASPQKTAQ